MTRCPPAAVLGAGRPRPSGAGHALAEPRFVRCHAEAHRAAGKPARRFLAASPVSVIRVDPTRPPAHLCAWHLSPTRIPTRRDDERSERTSRDGFPDRGSRARTASAGAARARQRRAVRDLRQILEIARAAVRAGAANADGEKRAFRPAARDPRWVPNPARPSRCRRVLRDRVPPAHAGLREPLPGLSSRSGSTLRRMTRCPPGPCRCWAAVPVWSGPRAAESRFVDVPAKLTEAGKPARRFLAASSVSVIRVDPTRPPAHLCAWRLSPTRIRTRRDAERSESTSRDGFPDRGSRARTASAGAARARQSESRWPCDRSRDSPSRAEQVPTIALQVHEHCDPAVRLIPWRRHEADARVDHSLVSAIEVVDAKEQADAAGELLADDGVLMLAVCLREQDAGLASMRGERQPSASAARRWSATACPPRARTAARRRRSESRRRSRGRPARQERDETSVSGYSGPMTLVAPDGRVSLPSPDIPCERPT